MPDDRDVSKFTTEMSATTAGPVVDLDRAPGEAESRARRAGHDTITVQVDAARGCNAADVPGSAEALPAGRGKTSAPVGRARVHYDATLLIGFGLGPPVGVVRVDRYVAEFLARDPGLDIRFVMFDVGQGGFRDLTREEAALLDRILYHRAEPADVEPGIVLDPEPEIAAPSPLAATPSATHPAPEPMTRRVAARRLGTALTLSPRAFNRTLTQYAMRWLPITRQQNPGRRVATRIGRGIGVIGAGCGHLPAWMLIAAMRLIRAIARYLVSPDPHAAQESSEPPSAPDTLPPAIELEAPQNGSEPPPNVIRFDAGSMLLSMGNGWDYLDHGYLHRICRDDRVRFVCAVYDVIAMQFPFTTPFPPHIIHRHWVEIGHCAAHLLAISRFSADQYAALIAEPNGLTPELTYAYLPNLPRDRAREIGERPINQLLGRRFVMFCSTIEARKNHLLLLQLWDRLRLEFSPDELPILVFAGRWGWGTETVRLLCERNYRLRDRLLILNNVTDAELIWMYRNARFTLFPSLSEGYGLAAAESLAFGTPVVIANCPGLIEATEGLMPAYDPLDVMAWLREMRDLICDDQRLDALRHAAARYKGPAYETFGDAVRAIAWAVAEPVVRPLASD